MRMRAPPATDQQERKGQRIGWSAATVRWPQNTLVKTIGSFWPYATTLYDYIHRAMPLNAPRSLTPEEVYGVVAWLLHQNGIIPA